jgi:hypothetical protein
MSRSAFGLPENPPKDSQGLPCKICVNECRIPENGTGYCGVRKNEGGRYVGHTFNNNGPCNEMSQDCSRRRGQKCEDREYSSAGLVIPLSPPLVKGN